MVAQRGMPSASELNPNLASDVGVAVQGFLFLFFFGRILFITLDFLSLLKKYAKILKSVNLRYLSFKYFQFQHFVRIFR
jgi:hypothetical protein